MLAPAHVEGTPLDRVLRRPRPRALELLPERHQLLIALADLLVEPGGRGNGSQAGRRGAGCMGRVPAAVARRRPRGYPLGGGGGGAPRRRAVGGEMGGRRPSAHRSPRAFRRSPAASRVGAGSLGLEAPKMRRIAARVQPPQTPRRPAAAAAADGAGELCAPVSGAARGGGAQRGGRGAAQRGVHAAFCGAGRRPQLLRRL
jgi:hypothetical protein